MNATLKNLPRTVLVSVALAHGSPGFAQTGGTLLFAQPGVEIIDAAGVKRPAKQGDMLPAGARLLTPPNAIAQVGLADGSLLGVRPGSEVKVELPPAASDQANKVLTLLQGGVRVIGGELMAKPAAQSLTLNSGTASVQMRGADIETELVRPEAKPRTDGAAAGSYSKLLAGSGVLKAGEQTTPLVPQQVAFLGTQTAAPVPVMVSAMPLRPVLAPSTLSTGTLPVLKSGALTPVGGGLTTPKLFAAPLPTVSLGTEPKLALAGPTPTSTPAFVPAPAPIPVPAPTFKPILQPILQPVAIKLPLPPPPPKCSFVGLIKICK